MASVAFSLGLVVTVLGSTAWALTVHEVSDGEDLQAAIDAAEPNDTILVGPGTYAGPITIEDIDVAAFRAPDSLQGQEDAIAAALVEGLNDAFAGTGVAFTTEAPEAGPFSTIHVGGDGEAFAEYGHLYGVAEPNFQKARIFIL